ncbi:MAG: hypothetical protein ACMUEL_07350 [Flavobacteriales bacterium Tduv]
MGSRTYFWQYKALVWIRKPRYKGLDRVHAQHLMESMSHNLYRPLGDYYALSIKITIIN